MSIRSSLETESNDGSYGSSPSNEHQPGAGFGTHIAEIVQKYGAFLDDFERDQTPLEPADFD